MTTREVGDNEKEVEVAGVVMVTINPVLTSFTFPDGPADATEKDDVGYRDGGLLIPESVKVTVPAASPEGKHPVNPTVVVFDVIEQLPVAKDALERETLDRVMVGGKTTVILPPDGIGSSISAVKR